VAVSHDEMLSDSFPMEEVDGVVFKVQSSIITKGALKVNTGANAAEEATEEDEGHDDPTVIPPTSSSAALHCISRSAIAVH